MSVLEAYFKTSRKLNRVVVHSAYYRVNKYITNIFLQGIAKK